MSPLLLLLLACAPRDGATSKGAIKPPPAGKAASGTFVLAHTNDVHSHFRPYRSEWREDEAPLGGMVAIDARVRGLERQFGEEAVLFLDGGDVLTGTPLMELEVEGVRGGAMAVLFEAIGMDAWVLGNHELDRGYEHAQAFIGLSRSPVLSANVRAPCGEEALSCAPGFEGVSPWTIFEVNGIRVGVFGLTTASLPHLADEATMARLRVVEHAAAARHAVAALEPQVDLVVALTHIGLDSDRELARAVPGIDLIVGGHSHTRMDRAEQVGDSWIVQAGSYGRLLGVAEIEVRDGAVASLDWALEELDPVALAMPASKEVQGLVDRYHGELQERFSVPAGEAERTLARSPGPQSPLGMWAAESLRQAAGTDIGLTNSGGLRADIVQGPQTVGSLYEVFPFSNAVVVFEVEGSVLLDLMLRMAGGMIEGNRAVPQVAGMAFDYRLRLGAPEIVSATVAGAPLDLSRRYRIATNSFVAGQWKRNLGFRPEGVQALELTELDASLDRARREGIRAPAPSPIRRVD